jgi:hypothetical protein
MSLDTLYDYNPTSPTQITRELYTNVGSGDNVVGTAPRAVKSSTDFEIWDAPTGGTQLTEGVDYELRFLDTTLTAQSGYNVYAAYRILNATYQTGNIYITYKIVRSYNNAAFWNTMRTDLDTVLGELGLVKELTYSDSPYTIGDTDGFNRFLIDSSNGEITITLPTFADNSDKEYFFTQVATGGKITIDGEGTETINGKQSLYLQSDGDNLHITANGTEWRIKKYHAKYDTGWINTNDWTTRHLGTSVFLYDNLSGTFRLGEVITEATSGNTGIIQADTGSILTVKDIVGTGIWTNNRQITGAQSGATADVNEVSGSNKNQDTDLLHDFGFGVTELRKTFYISEDKTEALTYDITYWTSSNVRCLTFYGVDIDNIKCQTATGGAAYVNDAGAITAIDTADWYYKFIIEVII